MAHGDDSELRVSCNRCGASILQITHERTGGLCRPCFNRPPVVLTPAKTVILQDVLGRLDAIGWFSDLPTDDVRAALRATLTEYVADHGRAGVVPALCTATILDECIEDTGDYVSVVRALAKGSHGRFAPTAVEDAFPDPYADVQVSITCSNRLYEGSVPFPDDYVQPEFFQFVNEILADLSISQRFHPLSLPKEPNTYILFVSDSVLDRALKARLIPKAWLWGGHA